MLLFFDLNTQYAHLLKETFTDMYNESNDEQITFVLSKRELLSLFSILSHLFAKLLALHLTLPLFLRNNIPYNLIHFLSPKREPVTLVSIFFFIRVSLEFTYIANNFLHFVTIVV